MYTARNASIEWRAWQAVDKVLLSITDNGPGARKDQVMALCDETSIVNTKSGLGTHIIKDPARAIHCTFSLRPAPGAGTRFTLEA